MFTPSQHHTHWLRVCVLSGQFQTKLWLVFYIFRPPDIFATNKQNKILSKLKSVNATLGGFGTVFKLHSKMRAADC